MEYTCTSCGRVSKDSAFSDPKRFPFFPCDTYLRFTCRECGDEALERLHVTWYMLRARIEPILLG